MTQTMNDLIDNLAALDEEELLTVLGQYTETDEAAIKSNQAKYNLDQVNLATLTAVPKGAQADLLLEFGQRFSRKLNLEAYDLLCGNPFDADGETLRQLEAAMKESTNKGAAILAPLLVTQLGLTPVVGGIIAMLIVQKLAKAVGETVCGMWKESLEQDG